MTVSYLAFLGVRGGGQGGEGRKPFAEEAGSNVLPCMHQKTAEYQDFSLASSF